MAAVSHNKKAVTAVMVGHSLFTPIHIQVNQQREKVIIPYIIRAQLPILKLKNLIRVPCIGMTPTVNLKTWTWKGDNPLNTGILTGCCTNLHLIESLVVISSFQFICCIYVVLALPCSQHLQLLAPLRILLPKNLQQVPAKYELYCFLYLLFPRVANESLVSLYHQYSFVTQPQNKQGPREKANITIDPWQPYPDLTQQK